MLLSVRSEKGPTPIPSEHPSRDSFDDERDMNSDVIMEAHSDHRTAKKRVGPPLSLHLSRVNRTLYQALKRDGNRCMLSGKLDVTFRMRLLQQINEIKMATKSAHDAEEAAAAAPLDSSLAKKAAKLAQNLFTVRTAAQRATSILADSPGPSVPTNAAHIFSESTNSNLSDEDKVRNA
jgi:hypothetical protein